MLIKVMEIIIKKNKADFSQKWKIKPVRRIE